MESKREKLKFTRIMKIKIVPVFRKCIRFYTCFVFGFFQNTKIYGKQVLKYVPLIGWAWYFTESIFLKREWEHDKRIIQKDLQQACDYPDGYPVTVRNLG